MTGRASLALVTNTPDRLGLTQTLFEEVGDCRSWTEHELGKDVRDIVLIMAYGRQPALS
jgi:hypothetical protein